MKITSEIERAFNSGIEIPEIKRQYAGYFTFTEDEQKALAGDGAGMSEADFRFLKARKALDEGLDAIQAEREYACLNGLMRASDDRIAGGEDFRDENHSRYLVNRFARELKLNVTDGQEEDILSVFGDESGSSDLIGFADKIAETFRRIQEHKGRVGEIREIIQSGADAKRKWAESDEGRTLLFGEKPEIELGEASPTGMSVGFSGARRASEYLEKTDAWKRALSEAEVEKAHELRLTKAFSENKYLSLMSLRNASPNVLKAGARIAMLSGGCTNWNDSLSGVLEGLNETERMNALWLAQTLVPDNEGFWASIGHKTLESWGDLAHGLWRASEETRLWLGEARTDDNDSAGDEFNEERLLLMEQIRNAKRFQGSESWMVNATVTALQFLPLIAASVASGGIAAGAGAAAGAAGASAGAASAVSSATWLTLTSAQTAVLAASLGGMEMADLHLKGVERDERLLAGWTYGATSAILEMATARIMAKPSAAIRRGLLGASLRNADSEVALREMTRILGKETTAKETLLGLAKRTANEFGAEYVADTAAETFVEFLDVNLQQAIRELAADAGDMDDYIEGLKGLTQMLWVGALGKVSSAGTAALPQAVRGQLWNLRDTYERLTIADAYSAAVHGAEKAGADGATIDSWLGAKDASERGKIIDEWAENPENAGKDAEALEKQLQVLEKVRIGAEKYLREQAAAADSALSGGEKPEFDEAEVRELAGKLGAGAEEGTETETGTETKTETETAGAREEGTKGAERTEGTEGGTDGTDGTEDSNPETKENSSIPIFEKIERIEDLSDEDFRTPSRSVILPEIPKEVSSAIGSEGKPVVIKKNIFEKNAKAHPELTPESGRIILKSALYSTDIVGQTQKISRPNYWVAISTKDKNSVVVLEVNRNKDNTEIVGWRIVDARGLEKMKRQAQREDGQLLILTSEKEAAAALSTLPKNLSTDGNPNPSDKGVNSEGVASSWRYDSVNPRHWAAWSPNGSELFGEWAVVDSREVKYRDFRSEEERKYQGRDRTTQNSHAQVYKIADELNNSRMGEDMYADRGAPIFNTSGNPVSGNGRTQAIQTAYGILPNGSARALENGRKYREWVLNFAKERGIEVPAGAEEYPLLVRRLRESALSEEEIAKDTNRDVKAEYSRAESANENSEYFGKFAKHWAPGKNGDPTVSQNEGFLKKFFRAIGKGLSGAIFDADSGVWTEDAADIVLDACVGYVVGDVSLTSALFRNRRFFGGVFEGIYKTAFALAPLKGGAYDLTQSLQSALRNYTALKRERAKLPSGKKLTWEEFKRQGELENLQVEGGARGMSPEERRQSDILTQLFDEYSDGRRRGVTYVLHSYAVVAGEYASGAGALLGMEAPSASQILEHGYSALKGRAPESGDGFFGTLYARDAEKESSTGGVALARPMLYEESEGGYERESAANGSADVFAEIEAEKAKIREDAQKNGTWMKAPNGAPSKLNAEQWVTVRTKRFKRWFGDWEKAAKKREIFEKTPIEVSPNKGLKDKKDIKEAFRKIGEVRNERDGNTVVFPAATAGKIFYHKGFDTTSITDSFGKLFVDAIPFSIEPEILKDGHKIHGNVDSYVHYVNKFRVGHEEYFIRFTVVKIRNAKGASNVHSSSISEVSIYKNGADVMNTAKHRGQSESSVLDKKLAGFFSGVNEENVSKVVDENGEPLVVYHGTRTTKQFNVFEGTRHFFTDDRRVADAFVQENEYLLVVNGEEYAVSARDLESVVETEMAESDPGMILGDWRGSDFGRQSLSLISDMTWDEYAPDALADAEIRFARGGRVIEAFLNIRNPVEKDYGGRTWEWGGIMPENDLSSFGENDGLIGRNIREGGVGATTRDGEDVPVATDYVVLRPEQIKSATENAGTFDGGDGNILREEYVSESGEVLRFERAAVQGELWGLENGDPGTEAKGTARTKGTESSGNTSGGFSGENGRGIEYPSGNGTGTRSTGKEILLRRLNEGEFCHVERVLTESGRFDFTGRDRIESVEDVAFIFKKLEEAAVENSFAAIEGEDGKVRVLHLSAGSFSASLVNTEMITAVSERVKGRRIWFVHNHPGGILTASPQDVKAYDGLRRAFGEKLQEGIIIDLNSGKFGTFGGVFEPTNRKSHREGGSGDVPLKVLEFGRQAFSSDYVPGEMSKMRNSKDVAEFVSSHRLGRRGKLSVLILNAAHEVVGNAFLRETELKASATEGIARELVYLTTAMGGRGAILYGDFPELVGGEFERLSAAVSRYSSSGFSLVDVVRVEGLRTGASAEDRRAYGGEGVGERGRGLVREEGDVAYEHAEADPAERKKLHWSTEKKVRQGALKLAVALGMNAMERGTVEQARLVYPYEQNGFVLRETANLASAYLAIAKARNGGALGAMAFSEALDALAKAAAEFHAREARENIREATAGASAETVISAIEGVAKENLLGEQGRRGSKARGLSAEELRRAGKDVYTELLYSDGSESTKPGQTAAGERPTTKLLQNRRTGEWYETATDSPREHDSSNEESGVENFGGPVSAEYVKNKESLDEIYVQAELNAPVLEARCRAAGALCGARVEMRPGLKSRERAEEKRVNDYGGDATKVSDVIGGTLILPAGGSCASALEALKKAGADIVRVKKFNFGRSGYKDVKATLRFGNGGIGEVIIVTKFMFDAKMMRGGHVVYEAQRLLEKYANKGDAEIDAAKDALDDLSELIYTRGADSETFERAKAKASSSVQRLAGEERNSILSPLDINLLKSLSSGINLAGPYPVSSNATPKVSLIQKDIDDETPNGEKSNNRNEGDVKPIFDAGAGNGKTPQEIVSEILGAVRKKLFGSERVAGNRRERADYMKASRETLTNVLGGAIYRLMAAKDRQKAERHLQRMREAWTQDKLTKEAVKCAEAIRDGAVRSARTELAREIDYELRPFARLKERVLEKNRKLDGLTEVRLNAMAQAIREDYSPAALEELIERKRGTAESASASPELRERARAEAEGLAAAGNFSLKTPAELQTLLDSIRAMKGKAAELLAAKIEARNREFDADIGAIASAVGDVPRHRRFSESTAGSILRSGYSVEQRLLDLMRYARGDTRSAREAVGRFSRKLSAAMANKEAANLRTHESVVKALEESFGMSAAAATAKLSELKKEYARFSLDGAKALSLDQLIGIYLQVRQSDYDRALREGGEEAGFDAERLKKLAKRKAMLPELEAAIGPEGIAYADALCEIKRFGLGELQAAYASETGVAFDPPAEARYFPIRRNRREHDASGHLNGVALMLTALPRQYTERVTTDLDIVETESATGVLLDTESADAHFVAYHDAFAFARRLFSDARFVAAADRHLKAKNRKQGNIYLDGLGGHLFDVFSPKGSKSLLKLGDGWDKLKAIPGWTAVAALGGNLVVMVKNIPAFSNFLREQGFRAFVRTAINPFVSPKETLGAIKELMGYSEFSSRWGNAKREELRAIMDADVNSMSSRRARGLLKRLTYYYMSTNQIGDAVPILWFGSGIYRGLKRKLIERHGLSEADASRKAMLETVYVVEKTQLTRDVQNQSLFVRRTGVLGATVALFTREIQGQVAALAQATTDFLSSPNARKGKRLARAWAAAALNATLFGAVGEAFRTCLFGDDDEEFFDEESRGRFAASVLSSFTGGIPLLGAAFEDFTSPRWKSGSMNPGFGIVSNASRGAKKGARRWESSDGVLEGVAGILDEMATALVPLWRQAKQATGETGDK